MKIHKAVARLTINSSGNTYHKSRNAGLLCTTMTILVFLLKRNSHLCVYLKDKDRRRKKKE